MTDLFITLLLPFRNKHRIRIPVLEQPLVQLLADGLLLVVQLVDVTAPLMRYLEDGPLRLMFGDVRRRCVLRVLHLDAKDFQIIADVFKALWGLLLSSSRSYRRHDGRLWVAPLT